MSEDIWILGITMTKFGKHPDKDTIDLASEAALGALADAQVTMKDIGAELGVNESRVSQLHARAIRRLREALGAEVTPVAASAALRDAIAAFEANIQVQPSAFAKATADKSSGRPGWPAPVRAAPVRSSDAARSVVRSSRDPGGRRPRRGSRG